MKIRYTIYQLVFLIAAWSFYSSGMNAQSWASAKVPVKTRNFTEAYTVALSQPVKNIFNVRDYGAMADNVTDDSKAFTDAMLDAVKSGVKGAEVFVPAGKYLLKTSPGGRGMIEIKDAKDVSFIGEKETMLISSDPTKHMIYIVNSSNVTVRGFELDRNPFVFTQGRISTIDTLAKTVEVTIDKGYDEPDSKYLAVLKSLLVFTDPKADTWDHSRNWPNIVSSERISPMKWKFKLSIKPLDTYLNKRFLIWDNIYKGWGVSVNSSKDCLIEDVKYYSGGADAGIGVWGCEGTIIFRRFFVGIPAGSDRLIAASGGSQEFENRGTLILDQCDISRVDDDGVNMGTSLTKVLKQIDARNIVLEKKGIPYHAGDTIALWDWVMKKERIEARIVDIKRENHTVQLTLDRDVKAEHMVGDADLPKREKYKGGGRFEEFDGIDRVADFQTAGTAIIKNCRFQNMRARNILVKTSNSIIENNTFYNTHMTSIIVGPEFHWGEGPAVKNLIIRNNKFINIDGCSINLGCHKSHYSYDNRTILIEGNTFENYGAVGGVGIVGKQGTAVMIRNADGVTVRNNTFGKPSKTAPTDSKPLVIEVSKNVTIAGNTFTHNGNTGGGGGVIFVHGDGAIGNRNIIISNNKFEENYCPYTIRIEWADGVLISRNTIKKPSPLSLSDPGCIINLLGSRNVTLKKNNYENPGPSVVKAVNIGKGVEKILGNNESGIRLIGE